MTILLLLLAVFVGLPLAFAAGAAAAHASPRIDAMAGALYDRLRNRIGDEAGR